MQQGWTMDVTEIPHDTAYTFRNGVPLSVTVFATPAVTKERARQVALFVQDQWTVSRWTLNVGARFDYYRGFVPDQHLSAGTYVPARDFAGVNNVPNWKDITPRIGVAYDLFGNGKTAAERAPRSVRRFRKYWQCGCAQQSRGHAGDQRHADVERRQS